MSRKYIRQQIFQDFVFPNNEVSQYDVDDIVHDLNENSVSGTVNSFSATTFTSSSLVLSYDITWNLNGAEPWIRNSAQLGVASVHMLAPGQDYYKPWRVIDSVPSVTLTATTITTTRTPSITPASVGLTGFTSGTYYFEVRFIGHRSIYPVCVNLDLVPATPTPTPTSSPGTTPTPTPTPTPSSTGGLTPTPTPTLTSTSGETFNNWYVDVYDCNSCNLGAIGTTIVQFSSSESPLPNKFYQRADGMPDGYAYKTLYATLSGPASVTLTVNYGSTDNCFFACVI